MDSSLFDNLAELLCILPGHVYWLDRQNVYRGCNDLQAKSAGLPSRFAIVGLRNKDLPSIIDNPHQAEALDKVNLEVMETAEAREEHEEFTYADGTKGIFLSKKIPLRDKNHHVVGLLGMSLEITHLKNREVELSHGKEKAELYLENIVANLPGHVYWKDINGVYLGCNTHVAEAAGFTSAKDIIGKTDYDFVWKDQGDILRATDLSIMEGGVSKVLEESFVVHDSGVKTYLTNKAPLREKGKNIVGVVGLSFDITAQKKAEERERISTVEVVKAKAKAKAEEELRQAIMVYNASIVHDLRNPILSTRMIAENLLTIIPLLLRLYEDAKAKGLESAISLKPKHIQFLENVGDTLRNVANKMTDFIDVTLKTLKKALTGDATRNDLIICSMDECINQIMLGHQFKEGEEKKIHWQREYDFKFLGNPVLMLRILTNLILNSLYQINENNKGEIYISAENHSDKNILRVRDTAGGAPPHVMQNLFAGYQTTKKEGTGVGLAFCKMMMNFFGGDITCHTVYGDYMEFVLIFPKVGEQALASSKK